VLTALDATNPGLSGLASFRRMVAEKSGK